MNFAWCGQEKLLSEEMKKQNKTWIFLCIFVKPKITEQLAMAANSTRTFTIGIRDHLGRDTECS